MRAEMNQAAAASIRAQLLVGRLQMEDQRIAGLVRELDAVQADLAANAQVARRVRREAEVARRGGDRRHQRRARRCRQTAGRRQGPAAQQTDRRQQLLKQRESALARELQEEQARWQDINARLENFEQSIPVRR
jgi:hypothetical protein